MPGMSKIPETRRNISRLWAHVTGHQQSKHHVRPWHIEEYPKGADAVENLAKTQKSRRLLEFREEAQLRNERGAPPE